MKLLMMAFIMISFHVRAQNVVLKFDLKDPDRGKLPVLVTEKKGIYTASFYTTADRPHKFLKIFELLEIEVCFKKNLEPQIYGREVLTDYWIYQFQCMKKNDRTAYYEKARDNCDPAASKIIGQMCKRLSTVYGQDFITCKAHPPYKGKSANCYQGEYDKVAPKSFGQLFSLDEFFP